MTKEQIQERKSYLIQTIDARNLLSRYGVKIVRNRCKGFCHGGNDSDSVKVFRDGVQCFVCGARMDIFQIVQHFEHCDYWTAFQILGGTDEMDEKTRKKMEVERIKRDKIVAAEKRNKEIRKEIVAKILLYKRLAKKYDPMSEEWCFCKNRIFYWEYLFEYYSEKERF